MSDSSSLVAKTFRGRLKADPSLSVGDLMDAFRAQFDEKGTRDIKKVLDPPADLGWKSAPVPKWLVKLFVLYSHLLDIAPNTLVTSKKLREALQRLHDVEPIHTMIKKDDSEIWDWADARVRIGLAQLRELKNNTHGALDRASCRLPEEERRKLQTLLDKIQTGKDALALVPVVPTRSSSAGTAPRGRGEDADADPQDDSQQSASAVFEGILGSTSGRKNRFLSSASSSDPKTPDKKVLFKHVHSNKSSTGMRRAKSRYDLDGDDDNTEHSDDGDSESTSSSSSSYSDDDHATTKIKILPAGQKLIKKHKKKNRDDKKKKKNQSKKEKKQNKKDKKKERNKKKDQQKKKKRTCDDMDSEEMGCRAEVDDVPTSMFDSLLSLMDDGDTPPRSKKQKKMTHMMEEKQMTDNKEKNKKKVKSQSRPHDQEEDLHSLSKVSGFCKSNLYVCLLHPWKPV